jgi:drug/metabolite transporter (DMT)-like permease
MNRRVLLLLVAMNVLWAGTYSATKALMADAPFYLVTSIRYALAAVPLVVMAAARGSLSMPAGDLLRCALMGVATFTLTPLFMYAGVGISRAADGAVLTSLEPLLISLGAYLTLRERIAPRTVAALGVSFAGALLLSEFWRQARGINPWGTALILLGVLFEATYSVVGKALLARHSPLKLTAVSIASASAVNVLAITAWGAWPRAAGLSLPDWLLLAGYLAGVCTVFGYTVWFMVLSAHVTANVAITIFTQPALGILIAWAWLGERPSLPQIAGTAVVLAAVAFAAYRREPAEPEPEPVPPPA